MRCAILTCAIAVCPAAAQTVLFSNGPFITGATSMNGSPAPGGGQWSELAADMTNFSANKIVGYGANSADPLLPRIADDFTVPPGQTWTISQVRILAYQNQTGTTSTVSGVTLRIWSAAPNAGGQVLFGDEGTNRLAQTTFSGVYRTANSTVPPACGGSQPGGPQNNRPLMNVYAAVNQAFGPGTYWIDVNVTGSLSAAISLIPTTVPLVRQPSAQPNAIRRSGGGWFLMTDDGVGCSPFLAGQELFFEIIGTSAGGPPACYANCDQSTQVPVLNVADFSCFLTKFAAGDAYANCDNSTQPPTLNVADFSCFLTKFAAGCP